MEKIVRIPKDEYYLKIAERVAERSTCLRRLVGSVIVKRDRIVSTGYVGAPRKEPNCIDLGKCKRLELNLPSGMFYEICRSVHAEENAIINAASSGVEIYGATLYIFSKPRSKDYYPKGQEPSSLYLPCYRCKKLIINSGLEKVVVLANDKVKEIPIEELRELLREDEKKQDELYSWLIKKWKSNLQE